MDWIQLTRNCLTTLTIKESNKNKILKLTRLILDELQRYQTFYELDTHNLLSSK